MRRLTRAMLSLPLLAGCGRSGPGEQVGSRTFEVTAPPDGAGSIDVMIGDSVAGTCPGDCGTFTFQPGAWVTLDAHGDEGHFGAWSGDAEDACAGGSHCEYQAYSDQLVGADFLATLFVVSSGGGSVASVPDGIDCPGTSCAADFPYGADVELVTAGGGRILTDWGADCATDEDRRCSLTLEGDRSAIAFFGTMRVDLFGTVANEYAEAVAADPLVPGGYVLAGSHFAPLLIGTEFIPWTADQDLFVARFDEAGIITWSETAGGAGKIRPHALSVVDEDGVLACYVGGSFSGLVQYESDAAAVDPLGGVNGFLAKYRAGELTPSWWHPFAAFDDTNGNLVADIDVLGNRVAIAGVQAGQMTLPKPIVLAGTQANRKHGYTALLDSAGNLLYAVHHGKNAGGHAEAAAVLLGTAGTISAGGRIDVVNDNSAQSGPCASGTNASDIDGWLYSLSADFSACGINQSTKLRPTGRNHYSALAWGPNGTFLAAGYTRTSEFGPTLTYFAANGTPLWTKDWVVTDESGAFAAAWDELHGEWVVAGSFDDTITIDAVPYSSAGDLDVVLVRLDPANGNALEVTQIGGAGDDVVGGPVLPEATIGEQHGYAGSALTVLPDGTAVVAGYTLSPLFGGRANAGGADFFVVHRVRDP